MTCHDFQHKWDELLDADARASALGVASGPIPGATDAGSAGEPGEEALLDHEAGCPDCRQLATRYRVLRQATRAWRRQPPLPSADLVDRILVAAERSPSSAGPVYASESRERPWSRVRLLASMVAASLLLAIVLNQFVINRGRPQDGRPANPPTIASLPADHDLHAVSRPEKVTGERPALDRALAEATTATWDLARTASEPAARISREMLEATTQSGDVPSGPQPEGGLAGGDRPGMGALDLMVSVPSLSPFAPGPSDASAALQQVGDHVAAGVRPLSDTARHAFGFLIGRAPDQAGPRTSPPSAKGA